MCSPPLRATIDATVVTPRHALVICRSNNSGVVCQFSAPKSHGSRLQSGREWCREASTVRHYCAAGASAKTHSLLALPSHKASHNGLDSRVLTCRCSVPNLGPRSSPFLRCHAWEGGRGLTVCGVSRRVISRTRTTVHNSLPDCRGFKTRATRSRGRLRERSNHCRCCALHWAGQKE